LQNVTAVRDDYQRKKRRKPFESYNTDNVGGGGAAAGSKQNKTPRTCKRVMTPQPSGSEAVAHDSPIANTVVGRRSV